MYLQAIKQYKEKNGLGTFRPKTVLFDMDGVLYDSMPNHATAWVQAMRDFQIEMTEEDAYLTEGQKGSDTIMQMVLAQQHRAISQEEACPYVRPQSRNLRNASHRSHHAGHPNTHA